MNALRDKLLFLFAFSKTIFMKRFQIGIPKQEFLSKEPPRFSLFHTA